MASCLTDHSRGLRVLTDFNEWLSTTPCPERIVIGGNHDWALEELPPSQRQALLSEATLLNDSLFVCPSTGVKVYGNSHSTGHSHNRAWQTSVPEVSPSCAE